MKLPDYVHRRVIVEYGRRYVYVTLTDANGKILDDISSILATQATKPAKCSTACTSS